MTCFHFNQSPNKELHFRLQIIVLIVLIFVSDSQIHEIKSYMDEIHFNFCDIVSSVDCNSVHELLMFDSKLKIDCALIKSYQLIF